MIVYQAADVSLCSGGYGSASASAQVSGGSDPSIEASVAASGGFGFIAGASGILDYFFQIDGPGTTVPVTIHGTNSLTTNYVTPGGDTVQIYTEVSVGYYGEFSNTTGGVIDSTFNVAVDSEIRVHLYAYAVVQTNCGYSSGPNCGDTALALALIDPTFTVPDGYSIGFSEGITSAPSSVPLPAALPLFASGLGALGLLGWRRKKKAAALAS